MNIKAALHELGVQDDTLTPDEKSFLDREGYLPLPSILTSAHIEVLRRRQEELLAEEGENAGKEVHQEAGTDRLSDLINKDEIYHIVITHPRVLAGIAHVLRGDLKLSSLNSRSALPGQGLQGLHADWGRLETPGDYQVCNSIWLLDDFTLENGATRIVPGSHRSGKMPSDEMQNPADAHPDEKICLGKPEMSLSSTHICGMAALGIRPTFHVVPCMAISHDVISPSNSIRRSDFAPQTASQLSEAQRVVLGVEGD